MKNQTRWEEMYRTICGAFLEQQLQAPGQEETSMFVQYILMGNVSPTHTNVQGR